MSAPRFHPLVRLILCAFAVLVAQIVAGSLVFAFNRVPSSVTGEPMAEYSSNAILLAAIFTTPITLLVVAFCRRSMDGQSFVSLGLRPRNALPDFAKGTLCGALAIAFIFGLLWVSGHLEVRDYSGQARNLGTGAMAAQLALCALAMLCIALSEEVLFRGYALHNLGVWLGLDKIGLGAAAIIQGILFALIHLGNMAFNPSHDSVAAAWQAMPNITLIGIFFALCYYKTGTLWFPIGFHAAWNFFLGSVFSLPVSGLQFFKLLEVRVSPARWLTGGPFGAEGSILLTILAAVLIYLVRQSHDDRQAMNDISALLPPDEAQDDTDVASRAPRLRQRKEQRREITTVDKPVFEGWNDLAPERRPTYSVYKPPIPDPLAESAVATEVKTVTNTPEATPATSEESFTEFQPVDVKPKSASEVVEEAFRAAEDVKPNNANLPDVKPTAPAPETSTPVAAPPTSAPQPTTPPVPAPPVKKPPAPRW